VQETLGRDSATQGVAELGDSDDEHKIEEQLQRRGAALLVRGVERPQARRAPKGHRRPP
jgi:hypothetical protein